MDNCNSCLECNKEMRDHDRSLIPKFIYEEEKYQWPNSVLLGVTDSCNLKCEYCFVKQGKNFMTLETARKAVDLAISNANKKDKKASVIFFGGEPLLRFEEIIQPIVEEYRGKVDFSITTNGLLLTEDVVDFLWENDFTVLLSFDGVKRVQDIQRPAKTGSSFDTIIRNIPYLLLRLPDTAMRATITRYSIPFLYKSYLMAEEFGFKRVSFIINAFEEWGLSDKKKYKDQISQICLHIYEELVGCYSLCMPTRYDTILTDMEECERIASGFSKFNNSLERCGLGTTSFSVTPSGLIVPCQEKISNPTWIIGDVNNGIDTKKHTDFLAWYNEKINTELVCQKECPDPELKKFCLARNICPSRLEDLDFQFNSSICYSTQANYSCANRMRFLLSKSILPKVKLFLEGSW